MPKNYIVWLKPKENLNDFVTSHVTVNTKKAMKMIPKVLIQRSSVF